MIRLLSLVVISLFIVTVPLPAQKPAPETYHILGISVEGNRPGTGTEPTAIVSNSGLRIGDQITIPGDDIHKAIERLWALKIFSDIQILIENKVSDGVYLLIRVKEFPRFDRLEIKGADDISQDDITKKVELIKGQVLTPEDILKAQRNILQLYQDEGHLLATVKTDTARSDSGKPNYITLRILIDEGPSVTIDKVYFTGNVAFSEDDLKGQFDDTKEKTWSHFWSHPKFDKKKFEADKDKLRKFFRQNGYLDGDIVSDSTWYSQDKKKISVLVKVVEGPQYKVRDVSWDGNNMYPSAVLTERLQFRRGDVFDEEKFDQNLKGNSDQTDVASLYLDNGYLKFNLDPEIKRVAKDSVDLNIHVYERGR